MIHILIRILCAACVAFCCTVSSALAQPSSTTYTLNGLWADVIWPSAPIPLGETFWISVALRPHAGVFLGEYHIFLDGRPLDRRDGIELWNGIADGIPDNREWYEPASLYATPGDVVLRITVTEANGRGGVFELPLRLLPAKDTDGDTLPDQWEIRFKLSPQSAAGDDGPDGDPDGDGVRNRDEFLRNTHPRGLYTHYFPEGIDDNFFETTIQPMPRQGESGQMHIRLSDGNGWVTSTTAGYYSPNSDLWAPPSYENRRFLESSFATIIESDTPFFAERWTKWPGFRAGPLAVARGSHASEGTSSLSTRWLFAEGVIGAFHTYVTLLNPSTQTARLTVTYYGPGGVTPVVRQHAVAPDSRGTIDVNVDAASLPGIDLSIAIDSDVPIAAERSIYRDVGNAFWGAGTSSMGAPAASAEWFFAEGLTNPAFDTYLLLFNPETTPAQVEINVLRADGAPLTLTRTIEPRSRHTLYLNTAHPALGSSSSSPASSTSTSFGLTVRSTNGTPIVAERSMWWDDPVRGTRWVEGHTAMGATEPATRWFAPPTYLWGWGGANAVYLLLANPNATPATVRVTLPPLFPSTPIGEVTLTVPAYGRATFDVTAAFVPEEGRPDGRHTALLVESIGDNPVPIVAERSVYANSRDAVWELGSNTRLRPLPPAAPGATGM